MLETSFGQPQCHVNPYMCHPSEDPKFSVDPGTALVATATSLIMANPQVQGALQQGAYSALQFLTGAGYALMNSIFSSRNSWVDQCLLDLSSAADSQRFIIDYQAKKFSQSLERFAAEDKVDLSKEPFAIYAMGSLGRGTSVQESDIEYFVVFETLSPHANQVYTLLEKVMGHQTNPRIDGTFSPTNPAEQAACGLSDSFDPMFMGMGSRDPQPISCMAHVILKGDTTFSSIDLEHRRLIYYGGQTSSLEKWVETLPVYEPKQNSVFPLSEIQEYVQLKRGVLDYLESSISFLFRQFISQQHTDKIPLEKLSLLVENELIDPSLGMKTGSLFRAISDIKSSYLKESDSRMLDGQEFQDLLIDKLEKHRLDLSSMFDIRDALLKLRGSIPEEEL